MIDAVEFRRVFEAKAPVDGCRAPIGTRLVDRADTAVLHGMAAVGAAAARSTRIDYEKRLWQA